MKNTFLPGMQGTLKLYLLLSRGLKPVIVFFILITASHHVKTQMIWNTGNLFFSYTGAGQQDCITAQTCLTRTTVLFNSVCQTVSGSQGCLYTGPCNTEWAYGNIANWNTLTYQRLYLVNGCSPPTMVNNPMVCHLIAENIYLQITFNSWTPGTNGAFSYTRTTSSTLPVSLSDFQARKSGNAILLDWRSSTEANFSHYHIQRSANGSDFITLGRVDSRSINGNSSTILDYSYTDAHPAPGHNTYRLDITDKDGHHHFSKVVDLYNSSYGSTITILQHPADQMVNIQIASLKTSTVTVQLTDMNGRILKSLRAGIEKGNNNLPMSLDPLTQGVYIIRVFEDGKFSFSGKILK